MSKFKKLDEYWGKKLAIGIKLIVIGWSFGIIGWCFARLLDRSPWVINNVQLSPNQLEWYVFVLFQVVPIAFAVIGCYLFRKINPKLAVLFLVLSSGFFVWVG